MNQVIAHYSDKGTARGGLVLFPCDVAIEIVEALNKSGLRVYGVDGFSLEHGETQPMQEHSIDLSNVSRPWVPAVEFLRSKKGKALFFEIIAD
jgi:hypothetical protein